jgi:peptidoglycan/xylan/chitin deacetylase (PgdA/CDA1 family)
MNVIMFHSVGNTKPTWYCNWLSLNLNHFDWFCSYLKKKDYRTIKLDEWYYLQDHQNEIKGKEIVLTFDDGYFDNWVFAFPILKKYGLSGTIFINPEFVCPTTGLRPTMIDVESGNILSSDLQTLGFLNWDEIKAMDESRVMDIQSHSMSHNFNFNTNKIIDIYSGQSEYYWLAWNSYPEKKPFYLTEDQRALNQYGLSIFEFYRALGLRQYFPDSKFIEFAVDLYTKDNVVDKNKLITILTQKLKDYPGRFESDEEMELRYRYELFESKRILEEKLNKKVEFLCWPGGGYNDLSIQLSIEAGYKASTIASREKYRVLDNSGKYKRIQRFGMGSFITNGNKRSLVKSNSHLIQNFKARTGSIPHKLFLKLKKYLHNVSVEMK